MKKQKFTRSANTRQSIRQMAGAGTLAITLAITLASGVAQAALHDRGGGLVYDDVLDVTWLADANYAKTSGYDEDGLMTWSEARAWVEQMTYDHVVDGFTVASYDDWRLPAVLDGSAINYSYSGTDVGYNVRTLGEGGTVFSELAYMYYVNLGFKGWYSTAGNYQSDFGIFGDGTSRGERGGLGPDGVIGNLQARFYWSDTAYAPLPQVDAWLFGIHDGYQAHDTQRHQFYAWAVRSGDVAAIPEPTSAALFGVGLALLAAMPRIRLRGKEAQG